MKHIFIIFTAIVSFLLNTQDFKQEIYICTEQLPITNLEFVSPYQAIQKIIIFEKFLIQTKGYELSTN